MKRLQTTALALLFLPSAAMAATSAWVETPGGDVRLVTLPVAADGTVRAMLDIRLHDGWKTYWRDPGGSGIPPSIVVTGANLVSVGFPAPKRLGDAENHYIGYDKPVRLPMTLDKADGAIKATVFLGVCKEICIPVQAELTADASAESFANPLEETAIAGAEARLPGGAEDGFRPLSGQWSADGKTVTVHFEAPANGPLPDVFLSGAPFEFGAAGPVRHDGGALVSDIPVLHRPKVFDLAKNPIQLTLRAGDRTMESPLAIE
ncbi:protein-disulfide reductase DsbD domain-containing protein [Shinella kummerowiae]|uniref:protein-disulfide reductase DsbD domain-containing protein n=1 Tax=Shinella kummerowiae TaxID=417745 RepID=UPI0021B54853|nr:protein-disulfide reductase DsbD domain-containing protein [Shinella kummerowiae]MCT7662977.1 protein-disulfide reductase DsbD family protein [Shinella kummerowiae]